MSSRWHLGESEFTRMLQEPPWTRYVYFVKRIAAWGPVWLLADESGYAQFFDEEGSCYLAVWPHEDYARHCLAVWQGRLEMVALPASTFFSKFARRSDGLRYSVFPLPNQFGYLTEGSDLYRDYCAERATGQGDAPWARA